MKIQRHLIRALLLCIIFCGLLGCRQKSKYQSTSDAGAFNPESTSWVDTLYDKPEGDYNLTRYDTPPIPVSNPLPVYPQAYRDSGIQGVVVLEVNITDKGFVEDVRVLKSLLSSEGGLDQTAADAVKRWSFKPALKNNKPVAATVNIPIPFSLK